MDPRLQRARARRVSSQTRPLPSVEGRPKRVAPSVDPRTFVSRMKRRIAAVSVVGFGAFFGLATLNVVGVTSLGGNSAGVTAPSTAAPSLPPGDFFGRQGVPVVAGPASQPQVILGGGPPMLTSGGS
jgi:hypothetical protein